MADRDKAIAALRSRLRAAMEAWDADCSVERQGQDAPDTQRIESLEASLREKDELIAKLEDCVNRYTATIIDLKHRADDWQEKYEGLKTASVDPDATSTELHPLDDETEDPGQ